MVTKKGLKKDPDLSQKVDRAVFPGFQGGPHLNQIAALAVALREASLVAFGKYTRQVVVNSQALAKILKRAGYNLIGGGTQNHMVWLDLTHQGVDGWQAQLALDAVGISVNRQTIPYDPRPPYYPSGLRIGTPAVTTRGMKEPQMRLIANWIIRTLGATKDLNVPDIGHADPERDKIARQTFKKEIQNQPELKKLRQEVRSLGRNFPIP